MPKARSMFYMLGALAVLVFGAVLYGWGFWLWWIVGAE